MLSIIEVRGSKLAEELEHGSWCMVKVVKSTLDQIKKNNRKSSLHGNSGCFFVLE